MVRVEMLVLSGCVCFLYMDVLNAYFVQMTGTSMKANLLYSLYIVNCTDYGSHVQIVVVPFPSGCKIGRYHLCISDR